MMLAGAGKQWTQKSRKPFTYRLLQLLTLIMADFDGRQKSRPQAGFLMPEKNATQWLARYISIAR